MGAGRAKSAGLSAATLKYIALACMLVDHLTVLVAPESYTALNFAMRFVGRTAAPLFFFFMAEGYHHTRDKNRYTMRLALFALVSYIPFLLFKMAAGLNQTGYLDMSVGYTLLLGFLALRARCELKSAVLKGVAIGLCLFFSLWGDWSYKAVLAVLLFDYFKDNRFMQQIGFLIMIFVCDVAPRLREIVVYVRTPQEDFRSLYWALMACGTIIPMLLIGVYNGERGKQQRWLFYVFYPVHLLVLAMLMFLLQGLV